MPGLLYVVNKQPWLVLIRIHLWDPGPLQYMADITWLIRRGLLITYKSWDDPPSVPGGFFLCVFIHWIHPPTQPKMQSWANEGLGWDPKEPKK